MFLLSLRNIPKNHQHCSLIWCSKRTGHFHWQAPWRSRRSERTCHLWTLYQNPLPHWTGIEKTAQLTALTNVGRHAEHGQKYHQTPMPMDNDILFHWKRTLLNHLGLLGQCWTQLGQRGPVAQQSVQNTKDLPWFLNHTLWLLYAFWIGTTLSHHVFNDNEMYGLASATDSPQKGKAMQPS